MHIYSGLLISNAKNVCSLVGFLIVYSYSISLIFNSIGITSARNTVASNETVLYPLIKLVLSAIVKDRNNKSDRCYVTGSVFQKFSRYFS